MKKPNDDIAVVPAPSTPINPINTPATEPALLALVFAVSMADNTSLLLDLISSQ